MKREQLEDLLADLGIMSTILEHPEVFTVEAMMPHLAGVDGLVCKNLFVRNKKKKLWLIVAKHDQEVNLNDVAKNVKVSGGFRFADEKILYETLGVRQGCVTPLALAEDTEGKVTLLLDADLISEPSRFVYSHPMVNDASLGMAASDLLKFFQCINHEPVLVHFNSDKKT